MSGPSASRLPIASPITPTFPTYLSASPIPPTLPTFPSNITTLHGRSEPGIGHRLLGLHERRD